jgi:hypothetical protein
MNVLILNLWSRRELELDVINGSVLLRSRSASPRSTVRSQDCVGTLLLITNGCSLQYVSRSLPKGQKKHALRVRNCSDPTHQENRSCLEFCFAARVETTQNYLPLSLFHLSYYSSSSVFHLICYLIPSSPSSPSSFFIHVSFSAVDRIALALSLVEASRSDLLLTHSVCL